MLDGKIKFLADDSCSSNKSDQQWWEYGSMKDCYLTSMVDLCHLLRHKGGDDGKVTMMQMKRWRENMCGMMWMKRRRENLHGMMWMKIRRDNPHGRRIKLILGGTGCWCIDRFQNWRWLETVDDWREMMMWKMRRWEHLHGRKTEIVNGCVIIPSPIGFRHGWWTERGDDGWGVIRKPRERWWGQVRKTLYVIVPEIILNARGLGSDLWWRKDCPVETLLLVDQQWAHRSVTPITVRTWPRHVTGMAPPICLDACSRVTMLTHIMLSHMVWAPYSPHKLTTYLLPIMSLFHNHLKDNRIPYCFDVGIVQIIGKAKRKLTPQKNVGGIHSA